MTCLFMVLKPCLRAYEFGVGGEVMGRGEMQEVEQKDKWDHCRGLKLWKHEDKKTSKTTIAHYNCESKMKRIWTSSSQHIRIVRVGQEDEQKHHCTLKLWKHKGEKMSKTIDAHWICESTKTKTKIRLSLCIITLRTQMWEDKWNKCYTFDLWKQWKQKDEQC